MKEIINGVAAPPIPVVNLSEVPYTSNKVYIFKSEADKGIFYLTLNKQKGYIFTCWENCSGGSTGWHETLKEAIESVLKYGRVYEFESLQTAVAWILHNN